MKKTDFKGVFKRFPSMTCIFHILLKCKTTLRPHVKP